MPQLQESGSPSVLYQKCVAVYDNVAECSDELAFRAGDVLTVIEQDTAGLSGWWLCSLRGRQGICPGNRLKLLNETDQSFQKEGKRRSWHAQPNKVVMPQKYGDVYLYDMPPSRTTTVDQFQYDVPPSSTPHPVCPSSSESGGEFYDIPRPLQGPLTPSSSVSSLTTDSNRSSLIQEYDIPRPPRHISQQPQVYDVPKELPLEINSALEYLGRLESETTGVISRLLAYAGPNWRLQSRLEPRLMDIKFAIVRLKTSLHDLAHFAESALANAANAHDKGLSVKLRPLVAAIKEADKLVEENTRRLEALGWSSAALSVTNTEVNSTPDALENIVVCATALTEDIRQIASFIQGNSTLLFKRNSVGTSMTGGGTAWTEALVDYDYVNLESTENASLRDNLPQQTQQLVTQQNYDQDKIIEQVEPSIRTTPLDPADRQIISFYLGQCVTYSMYLTNAIDAFLQTVEHNQPPKVFLGHIKFVVLIAHRLVNIGDTVYRNVSCDSVRARVLECANCLCEALAATVHKTKLAALHFPSVTSVQDMVDSVTDISHLATQLKQSMAAHSERHL